MGAGWAALENNAQEPGLRSPRLPGKSSSLAKLSLEAPLFEEFSGSLGEGRVAHSRRKRAGGRGGTSVAAGLGAVTFLLTGGAGAPGGVCGTGEGRGQSARRHGGTGPAQRPGHPAAVLSALAHWGLASGRGEEGAEVLAAGAAQPLALSGDCAHPQVQARQRLQMVSSPRRGWEGAESPGTVPHGTRGQPESLPSEAH